MVKKYRKLPVVIEAFRFDGTWSDELYEFCGDALYETDMSDGFKPIIRTLEGDMIVNIGDYIIKGVAGEIYPCKPKIFEQTYEEAYKPKPLCSECPKIESWQSYCGYCGLHVSEMKGC